MEWIRRIGARFYRILRLSAKCHRNNLNDQRAVTLTYYTLFAIVPLAALLFGITKGFQLEVRLKESLCIRFPNQQQMLEWIYGFASKALERTSGSVVAGIGIAVLMWSGFALADNVDMSFSSIWGLPSRRNLLRRFNNYFTTLFLGPLLLVVFSSAGVFAHSALGQIQEIHPEWSSFVGFWRMFAPQVVPVIITCGIFFLIYFFMPNTKVRWKPALFAAILAGIAYHVMQEIFLVIQRKIFTYNQVYGSFAILPLFLICVQWAWQIVLYGAEVGFVTQNLHTGLFDLKTAAPASVDLQLLQGLTIAKIIFRNVKENRGATSWMELERRLGLAEVEIDRIVALLVNAGIIEKIQKKKGNWFLPGISTEASLYDCVSRLRKVGRNAMPLEMQKECADLIAALNELSEADKTVAEDKKIYEL